MCDIALQMDVLGIVRSMFGKSIKSILPLVLLLLFYNP